MFIINYVYLSCFYIYIFLFSDVFIVLYLVIQCQVMQMLLLRILFSLYRSRGTEILCNLAVIDNEVIY